MGEKCTATVTISGKPCNVLLDTGSQVTTVSESFYNKNLFDHPIKPIENLLEVKSANGQHVPYLGYVEVGVVFPKEFVASEPEISSLALVVPDNGSNNDVPVLIGTNLLDVLYREHSANIKSIKHSKSFGYDQIFKVLKFRHRQSQTGRVGRMMLKGKAQTVIPAGQKVPLEGYVSMNSIHSQTEVLLEQISNPVLPGGLFVDCCLVTLPRQPPYKLPVWVRNENDHDVTLPARCFIAELTVIETSSSSDSPNDLKLDESIVQLSQDHTNLKFDFGDSPLSEEWRNRIMQKLNAYRDGFAHHDLDFGHATKVKHRIKLNDDTPFKQKSRSIHPHDFEAVKKHLQTLLAAGIIRKSESPFSSPIVVVRKKNGDVRLCIDYRKLNSRTVKDAYALPNLEEAFSALTGSQWFSVMDLKSGYYQIEMEETNQRQPSCVPLVFGNLSVCLRALQMLLAPSKG